MKRWMGALTALLCLVLASQAAADWNGGGSGRGYSQARSLPAGKAPTTSVSGRSVTVSWQAATDGAPVSGYVVNRYSADGVAQSVKAGCSGTVSGLSCTEKDVPSGSWTYTVTPQQGNWRGAESPRSQPASVGAPKLTLSGSSTVTSLPATLTGSISNFASGQAVSFRLDDPSSGQLLAGTSSPTPTPADGQASVSVTIPSGTANGVHTLYAIGTGGDVAGADFTVAVPTPPTTITTSAWDIRDASGGAEVASPDFSAFADGLTGTSGSFGSAFSASRYLQLDLNDPLMPGAPVSSASFSFRFADTAKSKTGCFYFDVRRASTGALLSTHGSATAPVGCVTGTTQQTFTTALPAVSTTDLANDLRIRVYVRESAAGPINIDQGTVSVTTGGASYTLYEESTVDVSSGTPATYPWGIATAGDGASYTSSLNWLTNFAPARYLALKFPSYVPAGASISSVSFRHSYRSATTGQTCYYVEVYSGGTLLGTHGSATNPVSCNAGTTWVTDSIPLPEVTTAAQANNLTVRVYVRNSGGLKSQDDLDALTIAYVK